MNRNYTVKMTKATFADILKLKKQTVMKQFSFFPLFKFENSTTNQSV